MLREKNNNDNIQNKYQVSKREKISDKTQNSEKENIENKSKENKKAKISNKHYVRKKDNASANNQKSNNENIQGSYEVSKREKISGKRVVNKKADADEKNIGKRESIKNKPKAKKKENISAKPKVSETITTDKKESIQNKSKVSRKRNTSNKNKAIKIENVNNEQTLSINEKDNTKKVNTKKKVNSSLNKVKIIPLGGIGEIGKNITAIEYNDEIIVIDCGMTFPDNEMYGIDLVIPDVSYLIKNKQKVKGFFITHGHEDHIGGLPYILKKLNVPVYATRFTLSLIKSKLEEHEIINDCTLNEVTVSQVIKTDNFSVEFIRTCHSIADSCALSITTPQGIIFHTGDFKIDYTPVDGELIDLQRIAAIGKRGVLLLMADSTNVERKGYTISEKIIGENLTRLFANAKGRILVATFSSNIHRIQQIIDSSLMYNRKVAFSGRSMEKISEIAINLGYLKIPEEAIISLDEASEYPQDRVTIITTGSQGEPMSALSRIASGMHKKVTLQKGDYIIISASPIPGNKKSISKLIDALISNGAQVIYDQAENIHVSGHACQEELKLIQAILKPKFFVPVHGEFRHLKLHKALAESMGMNSQNVFIMENGETLELTRNKAAITETVDTGSVLVDGIGVGDVGNRVLKDRKTLANDGICSVVIGINKERKEIVSGPNIFTRGFIYVKDSSKLIYDANYIVKCEVKKCLDNNVTDWYTIKSNITKSLRTFLYDKTERKPMIIPIIVEI